MSCSQFLGWLDRSLSTPVWMLKISTSNSSSLTLTPSHVVFRLSSIGAIEAVQANQLVEGDRLIRPTRDGMAELDEVLDTQITLEETGYWAPLTREGTLLANGFLVSCYASFPHHQSDLAFALVKTFPRLLIDDEAAQHEDGVRQVVSVLKKIGEMVGLRRRPAEVETQVEFKVPDHTMTSLAHHTEL